MPPIKTTEKYQRPGSEKYQRGAGARKLKYSTKNKRLNAGLKRVENQYKDAVKSAAGTDILLREESGYLEAEGPMEKTYKFKQDEIVEAVDQGTANKKFELKLDEFGPYNLDYTRNGRGLLLGGRKGHVASIDWRTGKLDCELYLNETVHSVKYLQNSQYFAAAQKKYTFIYDRLGTELHRMKQHIDCTLLDFLPYHYLLTTAGNSGFLRYQDVSTGSLVSEIRTKLGPTQAMKQNPWNAVMHLGHGNGTVSLWTPSMHAPVVKIQASKGPVRDIAIDREGKYMAVSGSDKTLKIWDLRKFEELESYFTATPASSLDISDTGLLTASFGPHVSVWKDAFRTKQAKPYMNHMIPGSRIEKIKYVPFEDILGVGHQKGMSSLIIPGAGEANYDALELNPFETTKQRQEHEVKTLLNKLAPDTISLDPNFIGTVNAKANLIRVVNGVNNEPVVAKNSDKDLKLEIRPDVRSANSALRKHLRKKRQNVIDERKVRAERNLKLEKEARERQRRGVIEEEEKDELDTALSRFG